MIHLKVPFQSLSKEHMLYILSGATQMCPLSELLVFLVILGVVFLSDSLCPPPLTHTLLKVCTPTTVFYLLCFLFFLIRHQHLQYTKLDILLAFLIPFQAVQTNGPSPSLSCHAARSAQKHSRSVCTCVRPNRTNTSGVRCSVIQVTQIISAQAPLFITARPTFNRQRDRFFPQRNQQLIQRYESGLLLLLMLLSDCQSKQTACAEVTRRAESRLLLETTAEKLE